MLDVELLDVMSTVYPQQGHPKLLAEHDKGSLIGTCICSCGVLTESHNMIPNIIDIKEFYDSILLMSSCSSI